MGKKGFTLIEALISILILMLVVVSILAAFTMGRLLTEKAKNRTKAMNLLMAKMEWVKSQAPSTIEGWIGSPIIENNIDDVVGADELINDTRTTTVEYHNSRLKVTITLNWSKRGIGGYITKGDAANPDERLVTLISP